MNNKIIANKILIVSGATASGKSKLALGLVKKCNGIIINADSMQIYKGLPTLSAQPSKADHKEAKHRLYSQLHPYERCSAGIWLEMVKKEIDSARKMNRVPIVVGGTGMYISTLIKGLSPIPDISEKVKKDARLIYKKLGNEKFYELVKKLDPQAVEKINKNDKQRLIRIYEVFTQTSKKLSTWQKMKGVTPYKKNEIVHINLELPRETLYKKIEMRFDEMLSKENQENALDEVKVFIEKYPNAIDENYTISNTLGFREIKDFIDGKISHEEMMYITKKKTRNYAKRQLTWFRHQFEDSEMIKITDISPKSYTRICNSIKHK